MKATTLTVGYTHDNIRRTNREVENQRENIYKVSIDNKSVSWLDLRASYERSARRGRYDYNIPFAATHIGEELEPPVPQLPFLRKYDEANRNRDRVQFLATAYPMDPLSVTGSVTFGKDDFKDSPFGLLDDKHQIYALDVDYALTEGVNLFAFYSFEKFTKSQKARQWTPGALGDAFTTEPGLESNSNWDADHEDKVNTVGLGVDVAILPKKLSLKVAYSYSRSDGKIRLSSPVGTAATDNNAFTPVDFTEVDDVKLHTLNARLRYQVNKSLAVAVGYMWEKFDIRDFNLSGFTNVPTTAAGAYNGALLMGTLPKDYDVNVVYAKLVYSF
jgi:opacity protein-like surface antigen